MIAEFSARLSDRIRSSAYKSTLLVGSIADLVSYTLQLPPFLYTILASYGILRVYIVIQSIDPLILCMHT